MNHQVNKAQMGTGNMEKSHDQNRREEECSTATGKTSSCQQITSMTMGTEGNVSCTNKEDGKRRSRTGSRGLGDRKKSADVASKKKTEDSPRSAQGRKSILHDHALKQILSQQQRAQEEIRSKILGLTSQIDDSDIFSNEKNFIQLPCEREFISKMSSSFDSSKSSSPRQPPHISTLLPDDAPPLEESEEIRLKKSMNASCENMVDFFIWSSGDFHAKDSIMHQSMEDDSRPNSTTCAGVMATPTPRSRSSHRRISINRRNSTGILPRDICYGEENLEDVEKLCAKLLDRCSPTPMSEQEGMGRGRRRRHEPRHSSLSQKQMIPFSTEGVGRIKRNYTRRSSAAA